MYKKDISNNVPQFGQEDDFWCGGACAQMTLDGFPDPADRRYYFQKDLMANIDLHNNNPPGGPNWATSPDGLQGCLQSLSTSRPVQWVEFVNADREKALKFLLLGMTSEEFPTPVMIDQGRHWVVVVGWETDVKPSHANHPTLQHIRYLDPLPLNIGSTNFISAKIWNRKHWNKPVAVPGKWFKNFVVVGRPG